MNYRWVHLLGEFDTDEGNLIFRGNEVDFQVGGTVEKRPTIGQSLCDQRLSEGQISVDIMATEVSGSTVAEVLLFYDASTRDMMTAGLGGNGNLFGLRYWNNRSSQWTTISGGGDRINFKPGRNYSIQLSLNGSQLAMTVDGVSVGKSTLPFQPPVSQVGVFCVSSSEIVYKGFQLKTERPRAFVVMQFSAAYDELYKEVIQPVCGELEILAVRADDTHGPGVIIADIVRHIVSAKVVIAEITPANMNVYYEVGYAHALNKPTILIADKDKLDKLPFDVSPFRTLFYENSIGGKKKVEEGLRKYLETILTDQPRTALSH